MDDLVGALFAIFIAIVLLIAAAYLIVYVVLPLLVYFLLARQFARQVKRYEFAAKTKMVLTGIGGLSLALAVGIVGYFNYHVLVIAPMSVLLFFAIAVPTLGAWASIKKQHLLDSVNSIRSDRASVEARRNEKSREMETLMRNTETVRRIYDELLSQRQDVERDISELCCRDARTYTLKKRAWENHLGTLNPGQIKLLEKNLENMLKKGKGEYYERVDMALKLAVIKLKLADQKINKPKRILKENERTIESLGHAISTLSEQARTLETEIEHRNNQYQALKGSRIKLD